VTKNCNKRRRLNPTSFPRDPLGSINRVYARCSFLVRSSCVRGRESHSRSGRHSTDQPRRVIPAKAGIQPWGHDEASRWAVARKPSRAAQAASLAASWQPGCSRTRIARTPTFPTVRSPPGIHGLDSTISPHGLNFPPTTPQRSATPLVSNRNACATISGGHSAMRCAKPSRSPANRAREASSKPGKSPAMACRKR
jgi:hypothetical protein